MSNKSKYHVIPLLGQIMRCIFPFELSYIDPHSTGAIYIHTYTVGGYIPTTYDYICWWPIRMYNLLKYIVSRCAHNTYKYLYFVQNGDRSVQNRKCISHYDHLL